MTTIKYTLIALLLLLLCHGPVGAADEHSNLPEKRQLRTELPSVAPATENNDGEILPLTKTGTLTLFEALSLTLKQNPELQAFAWQIEARQGELQQADLLPNPELGIGVENILGKDDRSSFDAAETTLEITQLIELGGKRTQRTKIAKLKQELADWNLESARLDSIASTSKAFFVTLSGQARVKLARENLQLSEKVYDTVKHRVEAGKASPIAENQARTTLSQNRITLKKESRKLTASRRQLAACWGSDNPHFNSLAGNLETISEPPSLPILNQRLTNNPAIARQAAELDLQARHLDLAKAHGVPDMTLGGGIKRHEESDDYSFLFGVSFSLPVFDRNSGAIRSAQAETVISRKRKLATEIKLQTDLREEHELLLAAYEEADALRSDILPAAEENFSAIDYGYRQGQFRFLEVLEAQKTLFAIREQLLESFTEFHAQRLNIEQLTGQQLAAIDASSLVNPTSTTEDK